MTARAPVQESDRLRRPPLVLAPTTPWSLRAFDCIPLPAFWAGVVVTLCTFALFLLYTLAFGEGVGRLAGLGFENGWAAELLQDSFLGFAMAVVAASMRGARTEVDALRPALRPPLAGAANLAAQVLWYPRLPLAAIGLLATLPAIVTVGSPRLWAGGTIPAWTDPALVWIFVRSWVSWAIAARGMALELIVGWRFSQLAAHVERVDLLDRDAFALFSRRALRNVLLWMLLAAWLALNFTGRGWAIPHLVLLGIVALTSFALTAFLLPLLGPHRRLRGAKRAELARVRAALRAARDHALAPGADPIAGGRLADLVAYEARVAAASEWPIAPSMLVRLGLYLALGLGSWVGAGLVQHGIESALR